MLTVLAVRSGTNQSVSGDFHKQFKQLTPQDKIDLWNWFNEIGIVTDKPLIAAAGN